MRNASEPGSFSSALSPKSVPPLPAEALGSLVWEAAADGMCLTDRQWTIRLINPAFARLVGKPREELEGRRLEEIYAPGQRGEVLRTHRACFTTYAAAPLLEAEVELWDGRQRWFEVSSTFLEVPGKEWLLLSTFRDTTKRKRFEEQYRQAQRMEVVGRLAGGVAHDFNNLLTVINGFTELALSNTPPGTPSRWLLEEIRKAGDRAALLTGQLLVYSRQQPMQRSQLDLNGLIQELERMLQRLVGAEVELMTELEPKLPPVDVDPALLQHVLVNLAVNARDAMPQGGRLSIATRKARAGAVLMVSDTGVGMDEATKSRIFEPFFTTKEVGKGTGLGLATVHGIIEQFGGDITVLSAPHQGTTFAIFLPAADARSHPAEPPPEQPEPRTCGSATGLVAKG